MALNLLAEIDFTVPLFGDYMKRSLPAPARTRKTGSLGERLAGEELHSQRHQVGVRHRRRVSGNLACQAGTTQDVGGFDARQEGPGARPPGELDQFRTQVLLQGAPTERSPSGKLISCLVRDIACRDSSPAIIMLLKAAK